MHIEFIKKADANIMKAIELMKRFNRGNGSLQSNSLNPSISLEGDLIPTAIDRPGNKGGNFTRLPNGVGLIPGIVNGSTNTPSGNSYGRFDG